MPQFRVPVLEKFEFQQKVKDKDLATPPVTPAPVKGDRYIVAVSTTRAWLGQEKKIAWFEGVNWKFDFTTSDTVAYRHCFQNSIMLPQELRRGK